MAFDEKTWKRCHSCARAFVEDLTPLRLIEKMKHHLLSAKKLAPRRPWRSVTLLPAQNFARSPNLKSKMTQHNQIRKHIAAKNGFQNAWNMENPNIYNLKFETSAKCCLVYSLSSMYRMTYVLLALWRLVWRISRAERWDSPGGWGPRGHKEPKKAKPSVLTSEENWLHGNPEFVQ